MRVHVHVEVCAQTLEVTNLELLHIHVAGVIGGEWAQLRAQILDRLHKIVSTTLVISIVWLKAHDRVLSKLVEATGLE